MRNTIVILFLFVVCAAILGGCAAMDDTPSCEDLPGEIKKLAQRLKNCKNQACRKRIIEDLKPLRAALKLCETDEPAGTKQCQDEFDALKVCSVRAVKAHCSDQLSDIEKCKEDAPKPPPVDCQERCADKPNPTACEEKCNCIAECKGKPGLKDCIENCKNGDGGVVIQPTGGCPDCCETYSNPANCKKKCRTCKNRCKNKVACFKNCIKPFIKCTKA